MDLAIIRVPSRNLLCLTTIFFILTSTFTYDFLMLSARSAALAYHRQGVSAFQQDDFRTAEKLFRSALKLTPHPHDRNCQYALTEDWLGAVLTTRCLYDEARVCYQTALQIQLRCGAAKRIDVARSMNGLGRASAKIGRYSESEQYYLRALEIRTRLLGCHQDTATSLNNLANLYQDLHRSAEAEELLRRAIKMDSRVLGSDSEIVQVFKGNLADMMQERGDIDEARVLYEQVLSTMVTHHCKQSAIAECLNNLSSVYREVNRLEDAEVCGKRAIEIAKTVYGVSSPTTAMYMNNLAGVLKDAGRSLEAKDLYRKAIEIDTKCLNGENSETLLVKSNLRCLLREESPNDQR
ncbi:MAG TPA: tetratricopeptide repeat protein [Oculatellaceae cyanobacterium]